MILPHTITVFNLVNSNATDFEEPIYTNAVVTKCLFIRDEASIKNKLGLNNDDTIVIYLNPYQSDTANKEFVDFYKFDLLSDDEKFNVYTFKKGDYIAEGIVDLSALGMSINEYKNKYKNIFEIGSVNTFNFGSLPNIVVTAG